MPMSGAEKKTYQAALEWYLDQGADEALEEEPQNRMIARESSAAPSVPSSLPSPSIPSSPLPMREDVLLGRTEAQIQAADLARRASTLDELRAAIAEFDGIALKKTATNMVFCDGHPQARVMLVGEAPGADEDRLGKPFVSVSGQLLDRILKWIGLDRAAEDPLHAIYISNILNWRPPGNRTPSPAEIEVSLPFIERHIELVNPKILILCGGVSAKALLNTDQGISRLRQKWHDYKPRLADQDSSLTSIPALATYHPAYLLRTPGQKRAVWQDMLAVQNKIEDIDLT